MTAASDKARFYLEQYVPELQEYAQKEIFTHKEVTSIASKRSDFVHILNARGSMPTDYARYATFEMNLSALVKKRCKRLGIKNDKVFSGQRTVFFVLDRATKKFPGDMSLWMQYIHYCQKQKAGKKLAKVLTQVLRLKPREWGLWVLAAKWYAEQQGDIQTARSYMQRGLRFCKDNKELWLEYTRLEMVYLAKLIARRKILGLDEDADRGEAGNDDGDMIALSSITAEDINPEVTKGAEEIDVDALQRLASAPAFTGAIPLAIFDAMMQQFHDNPAMAYEFFSLIVCFENNPSTQKILQGVFDHLQAAAPTSPECILCGARLHIFGIEILSAAFPLALGKALATINNALPAMLANRKLVLAELTVTALLPYLKMQDVVDPDICRAVEASLNRYLRLLQPTKNIKIKLVRVLAERVHAEGKQTAAQMLKRVLEIGDDG